MTNSTMSGLASKALILTILIACSAAVAPPAPPVPQLRYRELAWRREPMDSLLGVVDSLLGLPLGDESSPRELSVAMEAMGRRDFMFLDVATGGGTGWFRADYFGLVHPLSGDSKMVFRAISEDAIAKDPNLLAVGVEQYELTGCLFIADDSMLAYELHGGEANETAHGVASRSTASGLYVWSPVDSQFVFLRAFEDAERPPCPANGERP